MPHSGYEMLLVLNRLSRIWRVFLSAQFSLITIYEDTVSYLGAGFYISLVGFVLFSTFIHYRFTLYLTLHAIMLGVL